jgi:RIO kinase 2
LDQLKYVVNLAQTFLKLNRDDFAVLKGIEAGMRTHEWVPLADIARISGLTPDKAEYRLHFLSDLKLVDRETLHYMGYKMDFNAYDLLALSDLANRRVVVSLGDRIGVGKESVVYEALGENPIAIKFHREGRTSFKHVRRVRDHLKDGSRCAWIHAARRAARQEFDIMDRLYPAVSIPKPVALSRHAIAMELVYGSLLNQVNLSNPDECLDIILEKVKAAFNLGIIHADLSEYNVIVAGEELRIIDWPQAVKTDHPHAVDLLKRDVSNIVRFFSRKYRIDLSIEDALSRVGAADRIASQEVS